VNRLIQSVLGHSSQGASTKDFAIRIWQLLV
jgi:hypothetical protein